MHIIGQSKNLDWVLAEFNKTYQIEYENAKKEKGSVAETEANFHTMRLRAVLRLVDQIYGEMDLLKSEIEKLEARIAEYQDHTP